jgi:hypothetical protein
MRGRPGGQTRLSKQLVGVVSSAQVVEAVHDESHCLSHPGIERNENGRKYNIRHIFAFIVGRRNNCPPARTVNNGDAAR